MLRTCNIRLTIVALLLVLCVKIYFKRSNIVVTNETVQRYLTSSNLSGKRAYKEGKEVIYQPLVNCNKATFLDNYTNPCWKSSALRNNGIACSAKIMILGFAKCGTCDLHEHFLRRPDTVSKGYDYFKQLPIDRKVGPKMVEQCPTDWLEQEKPLQEIYVEDTSKTIVTDCPSCCMIGRVFTETTTSITLQTTIQFLQHTITEECRFVVSMREPASRLVSHFFFLYKRRRADNPYLKYTLEEVGNSFFHKLIDETIATLTKCLTDYGTTVCLLQLKLSHIPHPHPFMIQMFRTSAYAVHLREVFKFISKDKIYFSKLEEYSVDETQAMRRIFHFVGLASDGVKDPIKPIGNNSKKNKGYDTKPVLPETIELLKKFFEPFNIELADLLGDEKWLWK